MKVGGARYRWVRGLARAALFWEHLWRAAWPTAALAGAFAALALSDMLPRLPGWLHVLALFLFAGALAISLRHLAGALRAIDEAAIRGRLERDSGLSHRPLTTLDDELAGGTDDARALGLWQVHLRRAAEAVRGLRVRTPSPGVPALDPWGIRAGVLLLLVISVVAGGGDMIGRFGRALAPSFAAAADRLVSVDVWITPPAYTRLAPLFLEGGGEAPAEPYTVPVGSDVLAHVSGVAEAPRLRFGGHGVEFLSMVPESPNAGDGAWRAEGVIEGGDQLVVEGRDGLLAAWPLRVVPDAPPSIAITEPPSATRRAHLSLNYKASDDYGVTAVAVVIRRNDGTKDPATGEGEVRYDLPLARPGADDFNGRSIRDLTAHPWAGFAVRIKMVASDGRGQTGDSQTVEMVLPEREFKHPVARAIIEQRKKLMTSSAEARHQVAAALDGISRRPQDFDHDTVVYLALIVAQARLRINQGENVIAQVSKLLWDTALHIEDGGLTLAERRLERAEEELMRALDEGAEAAELERLMDELQKALDSFLEALMEQFEGIETADLPTLPPNVDFLGSNDLRDMLERIRELARTGNMDAARQLLSEFQRMMENLRAGMQPGRMPEGVRQGMQMMDDLNALIEQQQRLLDQTFRLSLRNQGLPRPGGDRPRQGQTPGQRQEQGQGLGKDQERGRGQGQDLTAEQQAAVQEALRRALGELMLKMDELMGNIPMPFGQAERSMRDAAGALNRGQPGSAMPSQTQALEQMRQAMQGMAQQMAQQMGNMFGLGRGRGPGRRFPGGLFPNDTRDPFGRQTDGAQGSRIDGPVKIPGEMELRRAHEILEELRRRSGDVHRPSEELEYIDRLLRLF